MCRAGIYFCTDFEFYEQEEPENRWGGGYRHRIAFYNVISPKNLLQAWNEFKRGKNRKSDVQKFAFCIEDNIFNLHKKLQNKTWVPDPYISFSVADPKPRMIHKASVRDRVLHQAVYRQLYPIFYEGFIHDSYASRPGKGTLRGVLRFEQFARQVSNNYTRQIFVLKCDIRKFFDCIDHKILLSLLKQKVYDVDLLWLLTKLITSFEKTEGKGLPLGNVTSQLFSNVYLNDLDQYVKRGLKVHRYIRYCDDFVIVGVHFGKLDDLIPRVGKFLKEKLELDLHPDKISIRTLEQCVDFLGYVTLPRYRVLRTRTKRRMFKRCILLFQRQTTEAEKEYAKRVLLSYKGLLSHSREYCSWKRLERLHEQ